MDNSYNDTSYDATSFDNTSYNDTSYLELPMQNDTGYNGLPIASAIYLNIVKIPKSTYPAFAHPQALLTIFVSLTQMIYQLRALIC